jgi:hypothetical protein
MRLPIAVLFALEAAASAAVPAPITWWITHPLAKVRPADPAPDPPEKSAELYAARNEFEPFQMVLRPDTKDASGVDVQFTDLRIENGTEVISKENISVYLERYLYLSQPSSRKGEAGYWPDPLIPRVDRYAKEARNAFPFDVPRGQNQPLWVEVFVPLAARPGKYRGSARVSLGGTEQFIVPIHLTVWAFTLPSTSSLKSSFGLNGINVLKQYLGRYTNDDDLFAETRTYAKAALLHRISIHGGSGAPPKYHSADSHMQIDWNTYDAEVGPFLEGTALSKGEPLYGAKATSVELRTPAAFATPAQQALYWQEWLKHFERKGWLDRLFLYLWDEPTPADLPRVLNRGRASVEAAPGMRNLLTAPFSRELSPVVHIWVPLVNCLIRKPGYDDFCTETPPIETYAQEVAQGKSLWLYQSCASHGCNGGGGEYFNGWPSYLIDASGPANRVMQWIAWKFHAEGELYYSINEAYAHGDPWTAIRLFGGNGDGTLFYPGTRSHIGGHTPVPIESIRLKLIREGMEDYEYLALLAKLGDRKAADRFADRMVTKPYLWESRAEVFLAIRYEMGEALERLATLHAAHGLTHESASQ